MLLNMTSLRQFRKPSPSEYQSVREFLYHGKPIYFNHSEINDDRWSSYEREVEKILRDPGISSWLDEPLDPSWVESREENWRESLRKRIDDTSWIFKVKRRLTRMTTFGPVLFWISHITAALSFLLIANTSELRNTSGAISESLVL